MSISQEIDAKVSIVDLASRYLHIKKAGVNYKALCPFHNEKTASFVISPTKNIAYCFSCHNGGGPVKFLSEIEKIPYGEAVQKLAKEVGIELKTDFYKERNENRGDMFEMHKIVANFYHEDILKEENKTRLKYLLDRGLTIETIKNFKIGYSGDARSLFTKLKDKGYQEKDIIESGIFIAANKDKFHGRITFPIFDYTGNIVAFTGRVLDASLPKYLNSPTTKIFDKSSLLFGLNFAKSEISKKGYVSIVEGQMDVISLHQAGFTNTVAISGTALTGEQIKLLKRLTKTIYLCLDNDNAGINATFASLENTINEDIDIKIVDFKDSKDPDEYLKSGKNWEDAIKTASSPVSYYIKEGGKKYDLNSIQGKKTLIKDVFVFLKKLNSRIEIDLHLKEISNALGISMDILYEEFKTTKLKTPENTIEGKEISSGKGFDIYEEIAVYLNLYNFFDLYFKNFSYNLDNIRGLDSLNILKKVLLHKEGLFGDEEVDIDRIKSIELYIEEENATLNIDALQKKFLDIINKLQKNLYEEEKKTLDRKMKEDPNSEDYLKQYMDLIAKGKKIGTVK